MIFGNHGSSRLRTQGVVPGLLMKALEKRNGFRWTLINFYELLSLLCTEYIANMELSNGLWESGIIQAKTLRSSTRATNEGFGQEEWVLLDPDKFQRFLTSTSILTK
jgi:hypothetical protein